MPSLIEGFGLVYSEALARGCHVIGTCNTGLPDLALGPDAVTLVEAGDLEELAAAIRTAARRASAGGFDRLRIAAQGGQWSRADFRRAIGAHAASVLAGGR
jgi:glycosyltransferase involved in cell wall biosynthesis